jgi:hypothetical protein
LLLSIFFETHAFHVYNKASKCSKLYKFLNINQLPSLKKIRETYQKYEWKKYLKIALKTLNKVKFKKMHDLKAIFLDSASVTLDLKFMVLPSSQLLKKMMLKNIK